MIHGLFLIKRFALFCLVGYFALFLNGCSKTQYEEVWDNRLSGCGLCHSSDGVGFGLDIGPDMSTSDKFYDNVVGKTVAGNYAAWATARTGDCDNVQLIKKGDAANSLVVASLVQSTSDTLAAAEGCNTSFNIHVTNKVTSASETWTDLVEWIDDGAPKE